jgi:hypothetical protein
MATGTQPISYQWFFENDSIKGAKSNIYYLKSTSLNDAGNYYCALTNSCGMITASHKNLIVRELPVVHLGNDTTFCLGQETVLTVNAPYFCDWNTGSTKQNLTVVKSGNYWVKVTDIYGCKNISDSVKITVLEPYALEVLCMVTVDSVSGKNLITWERTRGERIAYYNIYKESTQAGKYQKIGTLPFDSLSVFVDYNSNPRKKADRYALTVVDSCNNESALSQPHKTMHLTANKGVGTEVNLIWDHYQGYNFNTYRIYRGTSASNMTKIDSIQSTLFTYVDANPPSGLLFYQVSAVKLDTCSPAKVRAQTSSGPYSQSVSNLKDFSTVSSDYLIVNPEYLTIDPAAGSVAFISVFTNRSDWNATTNAGWLTLVKDYQNNTITLVAAQIYTFASRTDTITVTATGIQDRKIIITQAGTTDISEDTPDISFRVYPNPFREMTNLVYELTKPEKITIQVYNLLGMLVTTLVDEKQRPGQYQYQFTPEGNDRAKGIYFIRMVAGNSVFVHKIVQTY